MNTLHNIPRCTKLVMAEESKGEKKQALPGAIRAQLELTVKTGGWTKEQILEISFGPQTRFTFNFIIF